ncbi:MAG TPA: response regulator [Leptolyngbyaceae cyanobacterium]
MNEIRSHNYVGNILVVDDTPDNLRLLSAMLTQKGYKVRKALNGQMAITACQVTAPDLILLDINMPGMNGYEVCKRLKEDDRTKDIPVIFISALDDVLDKVKAFQVGGIDYITKPFQDAEVLSRISSQLNLRFLQIKLQEKNSLLEQTLKDLKQAESQLVQNEKMVSLGQLVAGIAHEINNPVGFIHGNLSYVNIYTSKLLYLLKLYQRSLPNPDREIEEILEDIDLEFLSEDLPKIMSSMTAGTERIRKIVQALKNFARHGEAELKVVDLHDGIDSTLMILQHRFSGESNETPISVIKQYGSLPLVECYAGQINQVFMNILSNSLDALESWQTQSKKPTITIATEAINSEQVAISIADNGPGMTEEVKKHIFDPFFTTKSVGAGTGLGLSISYQIVVESHEGKIDCDSAPGEGAKFTIVLPVNHPKATS